MFGPVLGGPRVTLRPADDSDAARFVAWFADLEVTRYLGAAFPFALELELDSLRKLGESKNDVFWVIDVAGGPIGAIGLHRIDWLNGHGETGIVIGERAAWGKGYATEAMGLRTDYAFRQLNLHKLLTSVFTENAASRRALARNGYREIGIEREQMWRDGTWHDMWRAEVLREDWERERRG